MGQLSPAPPEDPDSADEEASSDPEEAPQPNTSWKIVELPEMQIPSGQEGEELRLKMHCRLYRWDGTWKERGKGYLKIMENIETGRVRLIMRTETTLLCVANHYLRKKDIFCQLVKMKTTSNAWTWGAMNATDSQVQTQKFCAKFATKEDFQLFQHEFEQGCAANSVVG